MAFCYMFMLSVEPNSLSYIFYNAIFFPFLNFRSVCKCFFFFVIIFITSHNMINIMHAIIPKISINQLVARFLSFYFIIN